MATYEDIEGKPPRPGRGVLGRFLLAGLLIFLCAAATTATAALLQVKQISDTFGQLATPVDKDTVTALDDVDAGDPQTLLILGSDERYIDKVQGNPARSDTIILLRLDPGRKATAVMSIPRDLKVEIPTKNGPVTDKINAAYSIGGPALTVKTIKQLTGLKISHVVNIDFHGFQHAVDRLGCVYVDVARRYYSDNNPPNGSATGYATINVQP